MNVVPALKWWPLLRKIEHRPRISAYGSGGDESLDGWHPGETACEGGWNGANWTAAMGMMQNGWLAGARTVDDVLATMPDAVALADAWQLEAAGRFPCVPAYMSGDPECMWQTTEGDAIKPRICLVVNACYSANIDPDYVLRYGAAVCATLRALEAAGHGVAIYSIDKRSSRVAQAIIVRDFGEPLDTSVVAFAFHPAFLRRVLFANSELTPAFVNNGCGSGGYGRACTVTLADAVACLGDFPATPVVLSGVESYSRRGLLAKEKQTELLSAIGEELKAGLTIA